ncbi:hybrid sensor histidine kinase/response regulator [Alkalinema sp. FACHB-956]|uniref:sensor histidine kinase n=1 Tax=Alkalinema sp. FACHB-956 TaxID=2692768 RepID=UPI0016840A7A|nr:hybrid sensor histidine kinase/response regulator [Alkalinema sp. FACHB-956]MBD2328380.1 hybrid sensor histidine kinase/response regulator [Alkalinema sp. FACHB-956]
MLSKPLNPTIRFASSGAKRILLVNAIPNIFRSMRSLLRKRGYQVDSAYSGVDALIQLEQSPPDLLLLDTATADIDGYEVTRRIRRNAELPFFPIMLVADHNHTSVIKGLALGANDVIRPTVKKGELFARIQSMLKLKHSIDEQVRINQQHEDFIASLTHDLRTPLIAADHMLHLLRRGTFGKTLPEMRDSLEQVVQSNQTLLEMVDTLLEIYQYEAGCKDLYFYKVDLWELSQSVVRELTPLAMTKGLALNLTLVGATDQTSLWVRGDRLELRRLLTNLVGNAIRYTDTGSIELRLQYMTRDSPENSSIILEVEDTGIGIAPEEQEFLFERFRQGNHQRRGNGLGLYHSRQIIEAHHGTIKVESEVGKGTLFVIQFDLFPE